MQPGTWILITLSLSAGILSAQPPAHVSPRLPAENPRGENTLLWRISGKDGHQVSYLYGTFHLTDERVFNLGDSLYEAIRVTDGLAIELDPAEMTNYMLGEVKKQIENTKNIRQLLSDKDYQTYGPLLAKKLKKPQSKITSADVLREKHKWMQDAYRKGSMRTFLDMYLFDIARRQNKWTGGVEDMDDQRDLVDDIVDKNDIKEILADDSAGDHSMLEQMLSSYLRQDLQAINNLNNPNGEEDTVMLRRNRKMSRRMDSLSSVRKMVFAVGAAHLPGEHGLIRLLRERGFTVEPVFSSKKIGAADYHVQEVPLTWKEVDDEHGWYKASMPGKAVDVTTFGVLNMKIYIDLFDGMGYFTMAIASAFKEEKMDSLYDVMAKNIFHKVGARDYQKVTIDGAKGRVYSVRDEEGYKKALILSKKGIVYMAMGTAMKEDEQSQKNLRRFFDSFKLLEIQPKDPGKTYRFTDSALAYTLETPAQWQVYTGPRNQSKEWDSRLYISMDATEGMYYFFGSNTIIRGRFIDNDSSFVTTLKKSSLEKIRSVSSDTTYLWEGHYVTEFSGPMKDADMLMTARFITRGNRWHALLAMRPTTSSTEKQEQFFRSFSFLDYPAHKWNTSFSPDSIFSAWTPSSLEIAPHDSTDDGSVDIKYNSFDSSRSNDYSIINYHLNPYYWSLSDSAFWAQRVELHVSRKDSLVEKRPVTNGEAKGWEWIKLERGSHMFQRQRVLLNGSLLYSIYLCAPEQDIRSADANRYFENFRFSRPIAPPSFFGSKAALLLEDLFGTDSAKAVKAYEYVDNAPFTAKDLPLLHPALLRTDGLTNIRLDPERVNNTLRAVITGIKDSSSFDFAAENYDRVADSPAFIKNNLLDLMAAFPTAAHFDKMAALLRTSPPKEELSYTFIEALIDTPSLTAGIMPRLLPLVEDSLVGPSIARIALPLLDSGLISIRQILPYEKTIQHRAARRAHFLAHAAKDEYTYDDLNLIQLLGTFNDMKSNQILRKFLASHDNYMKIKAMKALLTNKQPLDPTLFLPIAADLNNRVELYKALKEAGKTALFPATYRTQRMFGESLVYQQAIDDQDGDAAPKLTFIATRLTERGGRKKKVYFYTVKFPETGDVYLGCAGFYDMNPARLDPDGTSAHITYSETLDPAHLNTLMDKLLKDFEEDQ